MSQTKRSGEYGEAQALARFVGQGIPVLFPWGDNARYDLAIDVGTLKKVQVKRATRQKNGSIIVNTSSTNREQGRWVARRYTAEEIDLFCAVDDAGEMYMIPQAVVGDRRKIALRTRPAKNGQTAGVHWARDYSFEAWLEQMGLGFLDEDPS